MYDNEMASSLRYGVYRGKPEHGEVVALMMLGDVLMSLCAGGFLLTWELGEYDTPKVRTCV